MKFLDKLMQALGKLPESIKTFEMFMIITAGIALVTFIILLVLMAVKKSKFAKAAADANKCLEAGELNQLNNHIGKMPKAQIASWKVYLKTRKGRPSQAFPAHACVDVPYRTSTAAKAPVVMAVMSVISTLLMTFFAVAFSYSELMNMFAAISFTAVMSIVFVAIIGAVLTLITYSMSKGAFKKSAAVYEKFCMLIDAKIGGAQPEHDAQQAHEYVQAEPEVQQVMNTDEPPIVEANYEQPTVIEHVRIVEEVSDNRTDYAEEQRAQARAEKIAAAQAAQAAAQAQAQAAAQQAQAQAAAQAQAQAAAQQAQAQAAAQAQAQAAAQQAQAQAAAQAQAQAARAQAAQAAQPMQNAQARPAGNEDIVARIDRMTTEGATQQQMREVAMLLQQERQKPENKTPEQVRRLNDALAKLLKAMSTAPKA